MTGAVAEGSFGRSTIDALSRSLSDPAGVAEVRRRAFERYLELPLEPNPLYRQYGYFTGVDLGEIDPRTRGAAVAVPAPGPRTLQVVHDAAGTHVRRGEGLGDDSALRLVPLADLWREGAEKVQAFQGAGEPWTDRLSALATAVLNRGYWLEAGDRSPEPIRVQDISILSQPGEALAVRRVIRVAPETRLILTEEAYSTASPAPAQRLMASATSFALSEGSEATALALHAPDPNAIGVYHRTAEVGPRARLTWIWAGFGGFRTKIRNLTELAGNGSAVDDLQTFFGDREQSYDSGIQMTHRGTDTHGQSITRGVFRGQSRGMSRGLVRIEPDARKTLSYLSEHAMLLSKGARSDTIPILEILCRDVKATHSSSVAPVDPEKVFYLESRGMREQEAVRMIGEGFLSHVLERAPIPRLREALYPYLGARWDEAPIVWSNDHPPLLPPLGAAEEALDLDWRFDAKLR